MSSFNEPVQIIACPYLAIFTATGPDTVSFLQSQLTQDMQSITPTHAGLAGFCTAQGRLWASMLLLGKPDDGVIGLVRTDLMESFLKRLRMFVLRSKVTFETDTLAQVHGLVVSREDLPMLSQTINHELPTSDWSVVSTAVGHFVAMPTAEQTHHRYQLIATAQEHQALMDMLGEQAQRPVDEMGWQALDAQAGIGWIQAATQDLFIAQTLNLDLLDGVSFTKGCYPGQEVVARAHYRGTVKRRMHLARVEGVSQALSAGTDVFEPGEPDNPVGRLISAVPQTDHTLVLFEAPFKVLEKAGAGPEHALRAGGANGPALQTQTLPYSLTPTSP